MKNSLPYNKLYKNRELFLLDLERLEIIRGFVMGKMDRFKAVIVVEFSDFRWSRTYGFVPVEGKYVAFPSSKKAQRALATVKAQQALKTMLAQRALGTILKERALETVPHNPIVLGVSFRGKVVDSAISYPKHIDAENKSREFAMMSFLGAFKQRSQRCQ